MKRQTAQQVRKVLTVYQHHFFKAQQTLALKKQALEEMNKKRHDKSQAISQVEAKLVQTQKRLVAAGPLSQWQAYQYHSKSQRALIGRLTSQKSKLEIQVAVAQMAVDKAIKNLDEIKHKSDIMENLEKRMKHEKIVKSNESDDELCAQQWQLAQPVLPV